MKNIVYEHTDIVTDKNGEVKEYKQTRTVKIPKEEPYIKLYIRHINYLNNLPKGMDNITYEVIKRTNYENEIIINSEIKRRIAKKLGKTFNTINQYITKLVQHDILIRTGKGVYILNPLFYGKGKWKDILELREKLEISITYEEEKYTITHKYKK